MRAEQTTCAINGAVLLAPGTIDPDSRDSQRCGSAPWPPPPPLSRPALRYCTQARDVCCAPVCVDDFMQPRESYTCAVYFCAGRMCMSGNVRACMSFAQQSRFSFARHSRVVSLSYPDRPLMRTSLSFLFLLPFPTTLLFLLSACPLSTVLR